MIFTTCKTYLLHVTNVTMLTKLNICPEVLIKNKKSGFFFTNGTLFHNFAATSADGGVHVDAGTWRLPSGNNSRNSKR